jgi:hypothetical protein
MVPDKFIPYFTASAAAAGVLIGLLFVAVALRPETIFGDGAPPGGRALAGSAFTGLVNGFFISVVALIPEANLGVVGVTMSLVSLLSTTRLQRELVRRELHLLLLILSIGTYVYQLVTSVLLLVNSADVGQVYTLCYLVVASFAVALSRAWALLQGRHLRPIQPTLLTHATRPRAHDSAPPNPTPDPTPAPPPQAAASPGQTPPEPADPAQPDDR